MLIETYVYHAQIQRVCHRGPDCFLVNEGIDDPNTTLNGPSSAASETPFKWHFTGWPMMAQH